METHDKFRFRSTVIFIIFLKKGRKLFRAKEWTVIPENVMALSLENLKLRYNNLLPALAE